MPLAAGADLWTAAFGQKQSFIGGPHSFRKIDPALIYPAHLQMFTAWIKLARPSTFRIPK